MDPVTLLLVLVLIVEIPWSMRSAYRLRSKYRLRLRESLFFRRLVTRNLRVAWIGGGGVGFVSVYSLARATFPDVVPAIPGPWLTVVLGLALIVLLWGPIDDERALTRLVQRSEEGIGDPHVAGED